MDKQQKYIFFVFHIIAGIVGVTCRSLSDLANDDRLVAPTENGGPVKVNVSVVFQRIVDFDDDQLTVDMGIIMTWKDHRLQDLSSQTKQHLHLRPDSVWVPDITPYDRVTEWDFKPLVKLSYPDATLFYSPVSRLSTDRCSLKSAGLRNCVFRLGTWTYDTTEVELQPGDIQFYEFKRHLLYNVEKSEAKLTRYLQKDECCDTPFPSLHLSLDIRTG